MVSSQRGTLTPPVDKRDHLQGPPDAPVTLGEYGDFECPYCGAAYLIVKKIQEVMGAQLRFVFRHFPLPQIHPHAEGAGDPSKDARAQGKFWQFHELLCENHRARDATQ